MVDVRVLSLLFRLRCRLFVDGIRAHRGQLKCVRFYLVQLLPI
jgi:hypothetical protein